MLHESLTDAEILRIARSGDATPLVLSLCDRLEAKLYPPKECDVEAYCVQQGTTLEAVVNKLTQGELFL